MFPSRDYASHNDAAVGIEASTSLVLDHGAQRGTECFRWNDLEAQARVERHVPRHVAERGQCDRLVPFACRSDTHRLDQVRTQSASAVIGMNIDLIEMR